MCGGTLVTMGPFEFLLGLSPRVRGNLRITGVPGRCQGSIPACAGEPRRFLRLRLLVGVYPRVCGGTAYPTHRTAFTRRVYPRVCGGTRGRRRCRCRRPGLSPRVRGNLAEVPHAGAGPRSIPACAGEPRPSGYFRRGRRVYPRVCGGTRHRDHDCRPVWGLSPRVRGNQSQCGQMATPLRSIPACAGEPAELDFHCARSKVYPRVCGGTQGHGHQLQSRLGLSPRVRGNPACPPALPGHIRSIPACAGEPHRVDPHCSSPRVYPRVCGGTAQQPGAARRHSGLSPRVRGNLPALSAPAVRPGSIPACAGEPSSGAWCWW